MYDNVDDESFSPAYQMSEDIDGIIDKKQQFIVDQLTEQFVTPSAPYIDPAFIHKIIGAEAAAYATR